MEGGLQEIHLVISSIIFSNVTSWSFGLNCFFEEERALVLDVRPVWDVYWELRALPVGLHLVSFK